MLHWGGVVDPSNNPTPFPDSVFANIDKPDEETGNGLYTVDHSQDKDTTLGNEWKEQPELRYAGPDPDNYVWFNCTEGNSGATCEKWRIIGLVNVLVPQTNGNKVEQRLKIIRDKTIGNYAWDRSSSNTNNWTNSKLMEMLNGIYYNSQNGDCWIGDNGSPSSQTTCKFDGEDGGDRGLSISARAMIDKDITWNIGGWNTNRVTTPVMYKYERGTKTGNSDAYPAEWNSKNTMDGVTFNSVGLMYPSDYGYASAGSNNGKTRNECIKNTELYSYGSGCYEKDWLLTEESYEWFLSPSSSGSHYAFYFYSGGYLNYGSVGTSFAVRPVVYLSSKVSIIDGKGTESEPFILTAE